MATLTAAEAFKNLTAYNVKYYQTKAAFFGGDPAELKTKAPSGTFWRGSHMGRKIHVPIASDISAASSDMLFFEKPKFKAVNMNSDTKEDQTAQKRLDLIIEQNLFHAKLNEAGECNSALGDVYGKVNWNKAIANYPIINIVQADCAWPEYMFDTLMALHTYMVLDVTGTNDSATVYRLYECHEPGKLTMMVFKGTADTLGEEDMARLKNMGYKPVIKTGISEILAFHVPNMKPNRVTRSTIFGRSDYEGTILLMDALDECYSSWMRDIRLGRARITVAQEYLRRVGNITTPATPNTENTALINGSNIQKPYYFDNDEEVYCVMDIDTSKAGQKGIEPIQFKIRSEDHLKTCLELFERIVVSAGYSPQTFGLKIEGRAESGVALITREKKTYSTKGKKETYWKDNLEKFLTALVHFDAALYPSDGSNAKGKVTCEFADGVANDVSTTSNSLKMLYDAESASIKTRVQMLHPDWSKSEVEAEVALIKIEFNREVPDPTGTDYAIGKGKMAQPGQQKEGSAGAQEESGQAGKQDDGGSQGNE